jgi:hypothetical protein
MEMSARFGKNIGRGGRLLRALAGLALAIAAVLSWDESRGLALALGGAAVFVIFEAARGWCVVRACGIKTRF